MIVNDPEENYKTGYIKIYRSLKKHWIWGNDKKTKFEAWIDLLLLASHSDAKEPIGYDLIMVKEGQILTSQEKLSISWRWDRNSVRKFLDMLQKDGMISSETTAKYTMITICKYDSYQNKKPAKNQQRSISAASAQHQRSTYNNDNNYNNVNNVIMASPKSERFLKFEDWLKINAERVTKMQKQITELQFNTLIEKHPQPLISDTLIKMHNYKPLLSKNVDAYLTLINWISRETK